MKKLPWTMEDRYIFTGVGLIIGFVLLTVVMGTMISHLSSEPTAKVIAPKVHWVRVGNNSKSYQRSQLGEDILVKNKKKHQAIFRKIRLKKGETYGQGQR